MSVNNSLPYIPKPPPPPQTSRASNRCCPFVPDVVRRVAAIVYSFLEAIASYITNCKAPPVILRHNQLREAVDARKVRKLERAIERVTAGNTDGSRTFDLPRHGNSANDVTRISDECFFLKPCSFPTDGIKEFFNRFPTYYKKDDILSMFWEDPKPELRRAFEERFLNDLYIEKAKIQSFLHAHQLPDRCLKNSLEYVSNYDLHFHSSSEPEVNQFLDAIKVADSAWCEDAGLAIKMSDENKRELLAGKILGLLGINRFLLPKIEIKLPHTKLGDKPVKEAIASRWIESHGIYYPAYRLLLQRQLALNQAVARNPIGDVSKEQEALDEAEKLLHMFLIPKAVYGPLTESETRSQNERIQALNESIQEQVLCDLLLCSSDSHYNQYICQDGQLWCLDFSQFLSPAVAYKVGNGGNATFGVLRSCLLDHPACLRPMSDSLIDTIKRWSFSHFQKQLSDEGLLGTVKEFAEVKKQMLPLHTELLKLLVIDKTALTQEFLEEFAKVNDLELPDMSDLSKVKLALLNSLQIKKQTLACKLYGKIDPSAFKQLKHRMQALQKYVSNHPSPTIAGAYEKMYPSESIFRGVLKKLVYKTAEVMLGKTYQDIIEFAQKDTNNLVSAKEIKQMEWAHLRILWHAIPSYHLLVAMNKEFVTQDVEFK